MGEMAASHLETLMFREGIYICVFDAHELQVWVQPLSRPPKGFRHFLFGQNRFG